MKFELVTKKCIACNKEYARMLKKGKNSYCCLNCRFSES